MTQIPASEITTYRFSDLTVALQTDSQAFGAFFGELYEPFRAPSAGPAALTFRLSESAGTLALDGAVILEDDPEILFPAACERILDLVAAHATRHVLIHAGAVAWDGVAILFPGYSHHGKTTVMLDLVRRGFDFLSDEIAALNRETGLVDPFPRRMRVWPRTLALLGLAGLGAPGPGGKVVLDVERLRRGAVGRPAQPAYIVTLWNPASDANPIDHPERTWYVVVDRLPQELVDRIRTLPGVLQAGSVAEATGDPVLRLVIARGEADGVLEQAAELGREVGTIVLDVVKGGERAPDFDAEPALEPISAVDAAVELARHFRGGADSRLLDGQGAPGPGRLFLELAALAGKLTCYRLRVGRLNATVDLIMGLVAERQAGGRGG